MSMNVHYKLEKRRKLAHEYSKLLLRVWRAERKNILDLLWYFLKHFPFHKNFQFLILLCANNSHYEKIYKLK